MAVLKIFTYPEPVLKRRAKKVTSFDQSVQRLIDDMIETMRDARGVGLAAPQVGIPLRLAVIEVPERDVIVLINPEIVKRDGQREIFEGCLSIPGYQGEVVRSVWVKVKARNRQGREFRIKGEELLAHALEHEIDHLNGVLYIDRLESLDKLHKIVAEEAEGSAEEKAGNMIG
ncbi:MAG TPA: peptide deformylase [Dehalococcoidia bacterium]|nr:peptide deformylase [Dehalococcoidia bacterium]